MRTRQTMRNLALGIVALAGWTSTTAAFAGDQPVAIFHAFDQYFADVESYVCELAKQGYSHVQIPPAQKSNPKADWYARYQPIDYSVIEGRGSETDLQKLTGKAHQCGVKVIADVVFNHMTSMTEYANLSFPDIARSDFHGKCPVDYDHGDYANRVNCWLNGDLPDLDQNKAAVQRVHERHIAKLLALGIDGFRFDGAKHMPPDALQRYIDYVNRESHGNAWNYLEVIPGGSAKAYDYARVAAVTNFDLYYAMHDAFVMNGDLIRLRDRLASEPLLAERLFVTFGRNHDNLKENNSSPLTPYDDRSDSYLATALVLARESGTPIVLNWDNADCSFIRAGVKFRQIITQRSRSGAFTKENFLAVINKPTVMMMERGGEGFFVLNKAKEVLDESVLDMTLTNLEGCYRELRGDFTIAIERRGNKKYVTRWGTWSRGGIQVYGREALFFVRDAWNRCEMK